MLLYTLSNRTKKTRKIIKPGNLHQMETKLLLESIKLNNHQTTQQILGTILRNRFTIITPSGKMLMIFGRPAKKL